MNAFELITATVEPELGSVDATRYLGTWHRWDGRTFSRHDYVRTNGFKNSAVFLGFVGPLPGGFEFNQASKYNAPLATLTVFGQTVHAEHVLHGKLSRKLVSIVQAADVLASRLARQPDTDDAKISSDVTRILAAAGKSENQRLGDLILFGAREFIAAQRQRVHATTEPGLIPDYPVVFRRSPHHGFVDIDAFFPTTYDKRRKRMDCYAHVGQHSEAHVDYARKLEHATEPEYRDLLRELRGIYERGEDRVRLVVKESWGDILP